MHDPEGKEVEAQLVPLMEAYLSLRNFHVKAYLGTTPAGTPKYWLAFRVLVPPFGFSSYTISSAKIAGQIMRSSIFKTMHTAELMDVHFILLLALICRI